MKEGTSARAAARMEVVSVPTAASPGGTRILSGRALIEVCLIDAATKLPITSGGLAVKDEHSRQVLGEFEFGGHSCIMIQIDPGYYILRSGADGYLAVEQTSIVYSNNDHIREVVSLVKNVLVRGTVRNSRGQPQAGAYVSIFRDKFHMTVRSGTDGRFAAELFHPEIEKIYAFDPPNPIVTMGPIVIRESRDTNLEITLPEDSRNVTVSGTVLDDLGHPIESALVTLIASTTQHVPDPKHDAVLQGMQQMSAKSDAKGRFLIRALPQSEALLTVAGTKGCELASESISLMENVAKDIHLRCQPTFRVDIQDEGGSKFADSIIVAETADGESAIVPTSEKGRYIARAYPFRIFAWTRWPGQKDYGVTRSEWVKGHRDTILLVPGHARVDGTVWTEAGETVRKFSVRVIMRDAASGNISFPYVSEDGSFSLKYLPAGLVTLEVLGDITATDGSRVQGTFSQEMALVEGQTAFLAAILKRSK